MSYDIGSLVYDWNSDKSTYRSICSSNLTSCTELTFKISARLYKRHCSTAIIQLHNWAHCKSNRNVLIYNNNVTGKPFQLPQTMITSFSRLTQTMLTSFLSYRVRNALFPLPRTHSKHCENKWFPLQWYMMRRQHNKRLLVQSSWWYNDLIPAFIYFDT